MRIVKYWLPVVLWAAAILVMSGSELSSEHTAPLVRRIVFSIFGHRLSPVAVDLIHFAVRRCGHIFEYTVLSALAFRAVRGERSGFSFRWAFLAIVLCFVVASSDEFRQSFARGRTASPWDVLLDTASAALLQAIYTLRAWHGRRAR